MVNNNTSKQHRRRLQQHINKHIAEELKAAPVDDKPWTPEQVLLAAILNKAVDDYTAKPPRRSQAWWAKATDTQKAGLECREKNRKALKKDAYWWIFREHNQEHLGSFEVICNYLGLDPEWKRKQILEKEQENLFNFIGEVR